MFQQLGVRVSRYWPLILVGWLIVLVLLRSSAPPLHEVVRSGEFAFLPADSESLRAERLWNEAFPDDLLASSIVIVARRDVKTGLITPKDDSEQNDLDFIDDGHRDDENGDEPAAHSHSRPKTTLKDYLEALAEEDRQAASAAAANGEPRPPIISRIRTHRDRAIGQLLISKDNKAALVIVELSSEFLDNRNAAVISKIEHLISQNREFRELVPRGLELSISGSAVVGRDMMLAAKESANATHSWTFALVILLLILIHRAPILAAIPLLTVFVSGVISMSILTLLARAGWVELFSGIDVYVTVVSYGAGVDYCLFLIARYNEELDGGGTFSGAIANALGKVGAARTASAGTVMCGIGMMVFAEFGKFRQAGVAITLALFIVLLAALTFTPAMLRLVGSWAFWPRMRTERIAGAAGWISPTSLISRLFARDRFYAAWDRLGKALLAKPGTIWLASIALMTPFALVGSLYYGILFGLVDYNFLTYGLLSELPRDAPSVVGTRAVQDHFPAGATGPVTVLIEDYDTDFSKTNGGRAVIEELTERLIARKSELKLADIRSISHPLGSDKELSEFNHLNTVQRLAARRILREQAGPYYVSRSGDLAGHVTRVDLIFENDPFSRDSIKYLEQVERVVADELAQLSPAGGISARDWNLLFIGPTASIRDLKLVTDRDQFSINFLVLAGVLLILLILLRKPAISVYLIVSVFFSYLVTLGVTFAVFWALDPQEFSGLDWKVPMFLFTILIAVGEDYNIFLMTRVEEEQLQHGPVKGVTVALMKTGSIISSCGIIMAGTFASLLAGSLVGMVQLGFALAFGVLLDTFVVRPILVPAYLVMLYSGRFGALGRFLGAREYFSAPTPPASPSPRVKVGEDV